MRRALSVCVVSASDSVIRGLFNIKAALSAKYLRHKHTSPAQSFIRFLLVVGISYEMVFMKGGAVHEEPLLDRGKFQKASHEKVRSIQSAESLLAVV